MDASGTSIRAAGLRGSRSRGWITGFQSSSETVPETSRRRPRSRPSAGRCSSSGNVRYLTSMLPPESSSRFSNKRVAASSTRSGIKSSVEAARRSKERNRDFLGVCGAKWCILVKTGAACGSTGSGHVRHRQDRNASIHDFIGIVCA